MTTTDAIGREAVGHPLLMGAAGEVRQANWKGPVSLFSGARTIGHIAERKICSDAELLAGKGGYGCLSGVQGVVAGDAASPMSDFSDFRIIHFIDDLPPPSIANTDSLIGIGLG